MSIYEHVKKISNSILVRLIGLYVLIILLVILCSLFLNRYWSVYTGLYHTIGELLCIFIALSTFIVIWHTYEKNPGISSIMTFGFLVVAVFDIFHTYNFQSLDFYPGGYFDLSERYWILGRFSEAIMLFFGTVYIERTRLNKYAGAAGSIILAIGISSAVLYIPTLFPVMLTDTGVTASKIFMEYIVIAILLANAFILAKNKIRTGNEGVIAYGYIFIALLTAALAEFCFTLFVTVDSFYNTLGHFLKVVYYYCIYRGVFISAITYPYKILEEKNSYINNILDELPIAFIKYNSGLKLSFANKKALQLMQCCLDDIKDIPAEQIANSFFKALDGHDGIITSEADKNLKPIRNKVKTVVNKWGRIIKLRVDGHVLENGEYMCLIEEARKEQELEDLQLQTQTILNSIKSMILIIDRGNRIVMCNKSFQYEFGLQTKDFIGMDVDEFREKIGLEFKEYSGTSSQDSEKVVREASFISPKGDKKEIIFHSSPIYNVHGEYIGSIDTAYDVTEFKKEQQKLQHQEKLALVGQMASGIVHQIKNPLAAIKGFSQILLLKSNEQKAKEYASLIDTSADEINKFVMSFLDLARPHPSVLSQISLNKVVDSISLVLKDYFAIKGIKYFANTSKEEKTVLADEDKIRQVILNIVSNAIDALNGCKDPEIRVRTLYDEAKDCMVVLIKDNGKGMPEEVKVKMGTPFFTTKENGTGLGMSICYQIINEHGGSIEVESEPCMGTCFKIVLDCGSKVSRSGEKVLSDQSEVPRQSMYSLNNYINIK